MAKPKQPEGQVSMEDVVNESKPKKSKRGFFSFLKHKGTVVKEKSNSDVTVFSANDKEYSVETSHGRFKRFRQEIKDGKTASGKVLSAEEIAYRQGVVNTMGEQARAFKKKSGQ